MPTDLMTDFRQFLAEYRAAWNRCNAVELNAMLSPELVVRWAYPGLQVHDWGYENATVGWQNAFSQYAGRNPKWSFEDVTMAQTAPDEAFVAYWVTFEVDGLQRADRTFFVETFRREGESFKKIREYVESGAKKSAE